MIDAIIEAASLGGFIFSVFVGPIYVADAVRAVRGWL